MSNNIINNKIKMGVKVQNCNPDTRIAFRGEGFFCPYTVTELAKKHIENKIMKQTKGFSWLKTNTNEKSFADLIFQYKNSVFAIKFVYFINGERQEEEFPPDEINPIEEFISYSYEYKFIPCFLYIYGKDTGISRTFSVALKLVDVETEQEINPLTVASDDPTPISTYERLLISVRTIIGAMESKEMEIFSCNIFRDDWPFDNIRFCDSEGNVCQVFVKQVDNREKLQTYNATDFKNNYFIDDRYKCYVAPICLGDGTNEIYRNGICTISYLEDILIEIPK